MFETNTYSCSNFKICKNEFFKYSNYISFSPQSSKESSIVERGHMRKPSLKESGKHRNKEEEKITSEKPIIPNTIYSTIGKDLNVDSVLKEIDAIEESLLQKRKRDQERRKIFENDEKERYQIMGHILRQDPTEYTSRQLFSRQNSERSILQDQLNSSKLVESVTPSSKLREN